jgi:hypothetical protein
MSDILFLSVVMIIGFVLAIGQSLLILGGLLNRWSNYGRTKRIPSKKR